MRRLLYHSTHGGNRTSILANGLLVDKDQTGLGAVFLTDVRHPPTPGWDLWQIEVTGLKLEEDFTTEPTEGNWFMCFDDISPARLVLLPGD